MSIAYWCILIAAVLPFVWVGVAKSGAPGYNNKDPRGWVAKQETFRVRNAYNAHLNAFEAFPTFAAGVLMAQFAGVDPSHANLLAMAFIGFRVLHGVFYISAKALLRSLVWMGGFACTATLMVLSALKLGVA